MNDDPKHIPLQKNVTKNYKIKNYDVINTISFQRSCSTVDDTIISQIICLWKKDNEYFEEVIDETLVDTILLIDRIVLPTPKFINEIDKDVSNKKYCRIDKAGSKRINNDDSTRNILAVHLDVDIEVTGDLNMTRSGSVSYSSKSCERLEFGKDLDKANVTKIFLEKSCSYKNVQSSHLATVNDHYIFHSF